MALQFAPNQFAEDEEDLDNLDPYDSISQRDPLEDPSLQGVAASTPSVKDVIAERKGMAPSGPDPMIKQFDSQQKELDDLRNSKIEGDRNALFAQIASQAARGASAPETNDGLYKNIANESNQVLKSKQEDLDRRQKILSTIEGRKSRENIASSNRDLRSAILQTNDKNKKDRLNSMNIGRANSLFGDVGINRETTKLNAARSAQTLINEVKAGHLKGSKNIRNQLTTIMSTIEMGGPGAVADRESMGVNNLYTKAKDALSFIDSHPNDSIPPEYLDQLGVEANALGDRAAVNYNNLVGAKLSGADLSGGNPEIDPGQIHQLATQRKATFLKSNGYDPETGAPVGRQSGGLINSANASGGAKVVKKQYSPSRNKTRIVYDDGSEVQVDGKQ